MVKYVKKIRKTCKWLIQMIDKTSEKLRSIKIPVRLMLSYILVSMIPVTVTGLFSNYIAQKSVLEKMNASSVQIAKSINYDTQRYLADLLDISNNIIYSEYFQHFLTEYAKDTDNKYASQDIVTYIRNNVPLSSLSDIRIVMENGELIHYKLIYRLRSDEMEKLKETVAEYEGLPVFVPVQLESGNKGISLVRAIYSSDSLQKIGEIYITVTEKSLRDIYSNIDLGTGSYISILNSAGEIISSNEKDGILEGKELLKGIESAKTENRGSIDINIETQHYLVTFSKIDSADWYIICMVPYSYLNSTVSKIQIYIYICVAICILACSLFTVVINRSISIPLTNLSNHMKNTGNNNLPHKIEDKSRDEIADVSECFNHMIDEINGLIEDVHVSEQQKSAEKLKALQAQINPHFLSNALNTVKWMASLQNAENIENLTTSLIQLLQVSMGKVDDLVPLSRELEYVQNYVEIQSFKYLDKFTVEYDIEEEASKCLLPPFSIQPIVENAIIHGIEPKAGKGCVWINASRIGEDVVCVVKDNGVGFQYEKACEETVKGKSKYITGIGMKNANERIKMHFGDQYGITYESISGIYTKVKVRIPYTIKGKET